MKAPLKDQFKVLLTSSLTEFGERYSYYMVQSLLILFLVYHFKMHQHDSAVLVGTIISMVYISAIIGGFIADQLLGYYRSAFLGALIMTCGSIILSFTQALNWLYIGLAVLAIGSGLIKSNISSFIGRYYDHSKLPESQRDFGFSLFYVGINGGAFLAQFLSAYLANTYGYNAAFYSSVFVNFLMIATLCIGYLKVKRYIYDIDITIPHAIKASCILIAYAAILLVVLHHPTVANAAILIASALCCAILVRAKKTAQAHNHPMIAGIFFILSIIYWAMFMQIFISIELFIKNSVNHKFLFFNINTTQFLSIESLCVLAFGFFTGKLWIRLEKRRGKQGMHDIDKFNLAFILMLLMFSIFYITIAVIPEAQKVPAIAFLFGFLLLAISELCLSAIGLSLMTKIAPPQFVALYMGIWLVTIGIGGKIAGLIGQYIPISKNLSVAKTSMEHGLMIFIICCIAAILLCIICRKRIIENTR